MIYSDDSYIKETIFKRSPDSHKGDFGRMLIFAGSIGMAGAAILSGRAALKTGVGLLRFLIPSFESPLYSILQISVPEATCIEAFTENSEIKLDLSAYASIVAGCGLGKNEENKKILSYIIEHYSGILVLDADALNIISEDNQLQDKVRSSSATIIMTPHIGEARRLLHTCEGIRGMESRKGAVCDIAERYNSIALLKGSGTLVAQKNKDKSLGSFSIFENLTGNPGMATGGAGDVLSGMIGALAAQGYSPIDSTRMGAFLHGKAGDLAAENLSEMGVTASDIVNFIPAALKIYYKFSCTITY